MLSYYFDLEIGAALSLIKLEYPFPKYVSDIVLFKFVQWFRRRRWKCEKFTKSLLLATTGIRQASISWALLGFLLRWAIDHIQCIKVIWNFKRFNYMKLHINDIKKTTKKVFDELQVTNIWHIWCYSKGLIIFRVRFLLLRIKYYFHINTHL